MKSSTGHEYSPKCACERCQELGKHYLNFPNFGKRSGSLVVIIQDFRSKEVLMHGYMNFLALAKTIKTGDAWLWSTSRQELWPKGATSDSVMKVKAVKGDCDGDSILLLVEVTGTGTACHLDTRSCFFDVDPDHLIW